MLRSKWILAALSGVALIGLAAGTAHAQSRGGSGGSGKFQFAVGGEAWTDSRGVIYSDAKVNIIAGSNPLDETFYEHDKINTYQHHGVFVTVGGRLDFDMPVRFGLRLGSFTANNRINAYNPGAARETVDVVTKPGFAGGLFADIKVPLSSGMWLGGTFDFYAGQSAIDNIENTSPGSFVWQGEYLFFLPELSARFGFEVSETGCSPFVGIEASFYQGMWEVEDPQAVNPGDLESIEATIGNWSFVRVIFGFEVEGKDSAMLGRFQVALWNPSRDFGGAVEVSFPFG